MAFKGWQSTTIKTPHGEVSGIAPVIISASRRTDIPAFYMPWFMNRLREGYCKTINPNNNVPQYVSFEKARAFVFWTKNPRPFLQFLPDLDKMGLNYYVTCTLNNYELEKLEPCVPPVQERIDTFKLLSDSIGKEKVIWRYDPLILSDTISINSLIDKVAWIGKQIHAYTEKLVISFIDIQNIDKTRRTLLKADHEDCREFTAQDIEQFAMNLMRLNQDWELSIGTCSEDADLTEFGIIHNKCIDDELLIRLFPHDVELMKFLGYAPSVDTLPFIEPIVKQTKLKDSGQRKACGCIPAKDIGQYSSCIHLCSYCYANSSTELATKNYRQHQAQGIGGETIF